MENAWSIALGVGPFTGNSFRFVIDDGQIEQVRRTFNFSEFSNQVWQPVKRWVNETHPQDFGSMYDLSDPSSEFARNTPEAIALWEQYTAEFVAETAAS